MAFLVDGTYICEGGGKVLLDILISTFGGDEQVHFMLDHRFVPDQFPKHYSIIKGGELARWKHYRAMLNPPEALLCFGNVPPPVHLDCPVRTYFQNQLILSPDTHVLSWARRATYHLKRAYIQWRRGNAGQFVVQSRSFADLVAEKLGSPRDRVLVWPFWDEGRYAALKCLAKQAQAFGYVSYAYPHKRHDLLLDAWEQLGREGLFPELHLTVPGSTPLTERIQALADLGLNVLNHGQCDPATIYGHCRFQIFPSSRESFGLGLVEAAEAGCKVLAPSLPHVHAVIAPSLVWEEGGPGVIAAAVKHSLSVDLPDTTLRVQNGLHEIRKLLSRP